MVNETCEDIFEYLNFHDIPIETHPRGGMLLICFDPTLVSYDLDDETRVNLLYNE